MRRIRLLLIVVSAVLGASAQQPAIPGTPAGRTLAAWLSAFNSGDPAKIEEYAKTIDPTQDAGGMIDFRGRTGGFDLLSIESSGPLQIQFRVKEKNSETIAAGDLLVKDGNPPTVISFALRALPPGAAPADVVVGATLRRRVIAGIEEDLTAYYIDARVAARMNKALDAHVKAGDYDNITDGNMFAEKLTSDLQAVSHDGHLRVDFNPFKMPPPHEPTAEDRARIREQVLSGNCAFDKVEVLPGNIGYVKFDAFLDAEVCGPTVAAAMAFVAHTDALIFDLRENGGGQPAMVTLIASYLFDHPTHLNDLYDRHENTTTQYWTLAWVPGERMATQPVFVLTSHRTFSGAEEFAYDLQTQKRATIVGEATGGGAHPVSGHPVADYFMVGVPDATAINPITKTNWEGAGVTPDVKVAVDDALTTAVKLATAKIADEKAEERAAPVMRRLLTIPPPPPPPPPTR